MKPFKVIFMFLALAAFFILIPQSLFAASMTWDELDLKAARFYQQKKYSEAVPAAEEALKYAEKNHGMKSPQRLISLDFLAYLCKKTGDYPKAQILYREVWSVLEKIYGPKDSRTVLARQRYEAVVSLAKEEPPR